MADNDEEPKTAVAGRPIEGEGGPAISAIAGDGTTVGWCGGHWAIKPGTGTGVAAKALRGLLNRHMHDSALSVLLVAGCRPVNGLDPEVLRAAAAAESLLGPLRWVKPVPAWAVDALTDPDDDATEEDPDPADWVSESLEQVVM